MASKKASLFCSSFCPKGEKRLMVSMKTIAEIRKQVLDFLDLYNNKKILLAVDDDEDGMTSAFQMQQFLEKNGNQVELFLNEKRSVAPGSINDEEEFNEIFVESKADIIIFCDLNEEIAAQKLGLIDKKVKVLIIDHHPSPKEYVIKQKLLVIKPGLFSTKTPANYSATKIVYDLFEMDALAALVGIIGDSSLGDWGEFGKEVMKKNKLSLVQVTRLASVIKSIVSDHMEMKEALFEFMYSNKSLTCLFGSEYEKLAIEFEKLVESERKRFYNDCEKVDGVELIFYETKKGLPSRLSNVLSKENKEVLVVYTKTDFVKGSVRRSDFKVDVGKLIKYSIQNSKDARGGGHIPAGGFSCPANDFSEFKKRAISFMKKQKIN